jgi:hypothetical protein
MLGKGFKVRPLHVAAITLGLTAGVMWSLRAANDAESGEADVRETLGFTDIGEYQVAKELLENQKVKSLSSIEKRTLDTLLASKTKKSDVGYGVLSNLPRKT